MLFVHPEISTRQKIIVLLLIHSNFTNKMSALVSNHILYNLVLLEKSPMHVASYLSLFFPSDHKLLQHETSILCSTKNKVLFI